MIVRFSLRYRTHLICVAECEDLYVSEEDARNELNAVEGYAFVILYAESLPINADCRASVLQPEELERLRVFLSTVLLPLQRMMILFLDSNGQSNPFLSTRFSVDGRWGVKLNRISQVVSDKHTGEDRSCLRTPRYACVYMSVHASQDYTFRSAGRWGFHRGKG